MSFISFDIIQVKLEVSHHKLQDGVWKAVKPLVFVLDNVPEDKKVKKEVKEGGRKKKKAKTEGLNIRNFGASLDVGKIKCAEHLSTAWRCRFLGYKLFGDFSHPAEIKM